MNHIDDIIQELELGLIEFTGKSMEERLKSLPLMSDKNIKSLIWNLLTSDKIRKKISYSDFSEILDIFHERRNESKNK